MAGNKDAPDPRTEKPGLAQALDALKAPKRPPTEDDVPPLSTFPMTPAARVAKALAKEAKLL